MEANWESSRDLSPKVKINFQAKSFQQIVSFFSILLLQENIAAY